MNPRKATSPTPDWAHVCDPPAVHPVPFLQDQPPSRLRRNFLQATQYSNLTQYYYVTTAGFNMYKSSTQCDPCGLRFVVCLNELQVSVHRGQIDCCIYDARPQE